MAETGWVCLPNPLAGWGREGAVLWKLRVLLRHIALVFRCWGNISCPHLLIREFSTLPLLLVFPFLWPLRRKLFFLIHHNLQWAIRSGPERIGLSVLAKLGARWALFETQELDGASTFDISSPGNLVLPHPVPVEGSKVRKNGEHPVIGVAGYYRPEKGMDELVRLLQEEFPMFGILLGVPNPEAVTHLSVATVSTASDAEYHDMLARCDVLVQNGTADRYFYRVSGPVADAAACGTAVVAPDFPMLGKQAAGIGEVFQTLEDLPAAVERAVEKSRAGRYDFDVYCSARSASALANHLDEFSNGKS